MEAVVAREVPLRQRRRPLLQLPIKGSRMRNPLETPTSTLLAVLDISKCIPNNQCMVLNHPTTTNRSRKIKKNTFFSRTDNRMNRFDKRLADSGTTVKAVFIGVGRGKFSFFQNELCQVYHSVKTKAVLQQ